MPSWFEIQQTILLHPWVAPWPGLTLAEWRGPVQASSIGRLPVLSQLRLEHGVYVFRLVPANNSNCVLGDSIL